MDFLYKLFSGGNSQAIETHRKVVYKQISLCCEDVSITKIPILRQNVGETLVILNTVQAIKFNKDEFQELANHAADLILGIWRSYKKSMIPEQWLTPPLQEILRGLLENLYSMRVFVEEQVSTNVVFRMMGNAIDMRQINRYHQRLMVTLDKFEIQSHISTNCILIRLLDNQKEMSNEIRQRNGLKNTKRDNNSKAMENKVSGLDRATKKPVKKVARKVSPGQHIPNPTGSLIDWNEALPSTTHWQTRSSMNDILPPTSNWPWPMEYRQKSHYQ